MIIAFEGVDGAGKNTLVSAVEEELVARHVPVARVGFPRYETSAPAMLVQRALYQEMGDLTDSIHGMASLFALDRHDVADELSDLDANGYVVLIDRFSASNAAYSAARAHLKDVGSQDLDGEALLPAELNLAQHPIVDWVARLEFAQLGIPVPDLHVLVDVDAEIASSRVASRAEHDPNRAQDAYERHELLQEATVRAYRDLAAANWRSEWERIDFTHADVQATAVALADRIEQSWAEQNPDLVDAEPPIAASIEELEGQ